MDLRENLSAQVRLREKVNLFLVEDGFSLYIDRVSRSRFEFLRRWTEDGEEVEMEQGKKVKETKKVGGVEP